MAQINFTIPDEKVQKIIDTMKWLFPVPQVEEDGEMVNEFTDAEWAKEALRRWIVFQVNRKEVYDAKEAIDISKDDNLIS